MIPPGTCWAEIAAEGPEYERYVAAILTADLLCLDGEHAQALHVLDALTGTEPPTDDLGGMVEDQRERAARFTSTSTGTESSEGTESETETGTSTGNGEAHGQAVAV